MSTMDTPFLSMDSFTLDVKGHVFSTAFSCAYTEVLVIHFFVTEDMGRCAPLFFFGIDDNPTSMLVISYSIMTPMIGESLPLEISTGIGSLGIPHCFPTNSQYCTSTLVWSATQLCNSTFTAL